MRQVGSKTDGEDYSTDIECLFAWNLGKIYGVVLTDMFTNTAFALLKIKTMLLISVGYERDCLRKVDVNGFAVGKLKIERVGCRNRAGLNTNRTTAAPFLYYVTGLS